VLHDFFNWVQSVPGATDGDPSTSWSQQFVGTLHFWSLTEGSHVLALMLFVGTILMVDLRMLGVAFRSVPYSALNDRVLPLTVVGFVLVAVTGVLLFLSNPVHYYHSIWFRLKVIFLVVAAINIFWFHYRVQKSQEEWDAMPSPPAKVKIAAAISLSSWILVIVFGRLIALSFFECETQKPGSFVYVFDECASEMGLSAQPEETTTPPAAAAPEASPDKTATGASQ
jgi:hypothetical protein